MEYGIFRNKRCIDEVEGDLKINTICLKWDFIYIENVDFIFGDGNSEEKMSSLDKEMKRNVVFRSLFMV